ncbi:MULTISPECIES: ABC transporter ATP-binding protein [unclassified Mesotoga]|uniref:ABC transporter ATP-binding protein n=1 Tax=unclassified Mesotoga TaxID=1184398 RepID=UPI000DA6B21F|nr:MULTISPECIES: ABC transporter ATP-binding protein [unclassified Mesotoga]PZC51682.1 amino acid ABC transporter ATPase [Mesotoga sp. TolDC]
MASEILIVDELQVSYGVIKAVKGITLSVEEGSIVTIIGSNGAGKSTTLGAISGLIRPSGGRISFRGNKINRLGAAKTAKLGISLVPEGRRIFSNLTVRENLLMGAYNRRDKEEIEGNFETVFSLFPVLRERLKQSGGTLSGGEQQMLAIGRSLMANPDLIMMDEPSLGLAPIVVEEVFQGIQTLNSRGVTILLVEQNAAKALEISKYAYVLETGKITLQGSAKELLETEEVRKVYLGI